MIECPAGCPAAVQVRPLDRCADVPPFAQGERMAGTADARKGFTLQKGKARQRANMAVCSSRPSNGRTACRIGQKESPDSAREPGEISR